MSRELKTVDLCNLISVLYMIQIVGARPSPVKKYSITSTMLYTSSTMQSVPFMQQIEP
jgi:hypothetical protein